MKKEIEVLQGWGFGFIKHRWNRWNTPSNWMAILPYFSFILDFRRWVKTVLEQLEAAEWCTRLGDLAMLIWKTSSHIRAIHLWYGCQHPSLVFLHAITSSIRLACYPNGLQWHSRWVPRQGSQLHPHTFVGQRFIESHRAKISKSSPEIPTFAPYNTHHLCYPKVQGLCFASSVQCQMRRPVNSWVIGW